MTYYTQPTSVAMSPHIVPCCTASDMEINADEKERLQIAMRRMSTLHQPGEGGGVEEKEDLTTYPPVERVLFVANLMRLLPLLDNLGIDYKK